jgi:uncharacterized RDD family membrane protein YckC
MPRWTETWLQGPEVTLRELRDPEGWPGRRVGLPKEGPGSLAPWSGRAMAFFLDIVASALASGLVLAQIDDPSGAQRQGIAYTVLALEHVVLVGLSGQTLGMRLLGYKVLRLAEVTRPPGWVVAVLRTFPLLLSAGLLGFFTKDGRGLHDVVAGSAVVRD